MAVVTAVYLMNCERELQHPNYMQCRIARRRVVHNTTHAHCSAAMDMLNRSCDSLHTSILYLLSVCTSL
eukprot:6149-Heterococcus_DN1.PRE.2